MEKEIMKDKNDSDKIWFLVSKPGNGRAISETVYAGTPEEALEQCCCRRKVKLKIVQYTDNVKKLVENSTTLIHYDALDNWAKGLMIVESNASRLLTEENEQFLNEWKKDYEYTKKWWLSIGPDEPTGVLTAAETQEEAKQKAPIGSKIVEFTQLVEDWMMHAIVNERSVFQDLAAVVELCKADFEKAEEDRTVVKCQDDYEGALKLVQDWDRPLPVVSIEDKMSFVESFVGANVTKDLKEKSGTIADKMKKETPPSVEWN